MADTWHTPPPGAPEQHLRGSAGASASSAAVGTAMLSPYQPAQTSAPDTKSISHTTADCKPHWAPHDSLPGAHTAAASMAANQQRSAPQQWAFPELPAPSSGSGAEPAQHGSSAFRGRSAAPGAYQAALYVFQRFSRQQEAMHFADCMNAEHRARAQVSLAPASHVADLGFRVMMTVSCCLHGQGCLVLVHAMQSSTALKAAPQCMRLSSAKSEYGSPAACCRALDTAAGLHGSWHQG